MLLVVDSDGTLRSTESVGSRSSGEEILRGGGEGVSDIVVVVVSGCWGLLEEVGFLVLMIGGGVGCSAEEVRSER